MLGHQCRYDEQEVERAPQCTRPHGRPHDRPDRGAERDDRRRHVMKQSTVKGEVKLEPDRREYDEVQLAARDSRDSRCRVSIGEGLGRRVFEQRGRDDEPGLFERLAADLRSLLVDEQRQQQREAAEKDVGGRVAREVRPERRLAVERATPHRWQEPWAPAEVAALADRHVRLEAGDSTARQASTNSERTTSSSGTPDVARSNSGQTGKRADRPTPLAFGTFSTIRPGSRRTPGTASTVR